jgi:hypothetical protein
MQKPEDPCRNPVNSFRDGPFTQQSPKKAQLRLVLLDLMGPIEVKLRQNFRRIQQGPVIHFVAFVSRISIVNPMKQLAFNLVNFDG